MASFETDIERKVEEEVSPIEQVRLTVSNEDDPNLPVWTFRMWFLGILSCVVLVFLNTFFSYRTTQLTVTSITVQVVSLPLGRLMAKVLPETKFRLPGFGSRQFSLNPGPFNMKEHVLISIFANAGASSAYAVGIVDIIKALYKRKIHFFVSWLLVITTQVLGYGWAGMLRKYVVEPAEMWWPSCLVQVSLFRALHKQDDNGKEYSRIRFFLIAMACSFCWYIIPGYLFPTITSISILCLAFPNSVTAQQIGSGMKGLGIGSFTFDWGTVVTFLGSPLMTPLFAILNVAIGYIVVVYMLIPIAYWKLNVYGAKTFPLFSTHLFNHLGQAYNVDSIINGKFEIDMPKYEQKGRIHLSIFFVISYGLSFASVVALLVHIALFNGKEIYQRYKDSYKGKLDIHAKLMKKYPDIPKWWFYSMLVVTLLVSLALCIFMQKEIQLPWWGLIFAAGLGFIFTLPISIISATTNQTPGLNVITEYIIGIIYPGRPVANVCFKTYGYISMSQAVSFLSDFKLGHYMKIPPRSMFLVQLIGTIIAGTINLGVAWYLLTSIENICQTDLLPANSPWTCPTDQVFYDASVIWGLVGPKRFFGSLGNYAALNWFFLGGAIAPLLVWLLHKAFPSKKWIKLINIPVLLGATAQIPPASTLNFNSWIFIGIIFNFFVYRYRKMWWQRYNYILSAALDAGLAIMGVLLYFGLGLENITVSWWGTQGDHCGLASCPTAKGVQVEGCPVI